MSCEICFHIIHRLFLAPVCLAGTASSLNQSQIASYEEVKALPRHPEKILIDVREPDELAATGIIPSSINIPCKSLKVTMIVQFIYFNISAKTLEDTLKLSREEFFEKFGRDKPKVDTEIIFHCKGGGRAGKATELAISLGFQK